MTDPATVEDRIARGLAAGTVTSDEIIPFPEDWGENDLAVCLRSGETKNDIFRLLNSGWRPTFYRYRSADGAVMLIVLRLDSPDRCKKKVRPLRVARQIGFRPDVVALGLEPPRPLYGLDRLAAAPIADVLLVEGEKAADAGQLLFPDLAVVTWQNGASGVAQADWRALAGRRAIIWPDNDDAGRMAAQSVAGKLTGVGAGSVRIVKNPSWFPPKWDVAEPVPSRAHA
ncbi:MAG: hypothetical protein M3N07_02310 [Pseudomonadota bacterium]|nr:hypothetical protein [Pseudomonadota bacterium]